MFKDRIKWLQAITFRHIARLLVCSGYGATARHRHILGIHYRIIKLYPTSKGLSEMIEMEVAYLATEVCDNLQTAGDHKDKIIGGTVQK